MGDNDFRDHSIRLIRRPAAIVGTEWKISRNDFRRWSGKPRAIWGPLYASNPFMDDLASLYSQAKSHLDGSREMALMLKLSAFPRPIADGEKS